MLALIGNLDLMELVVIAAAALMIFGKRLPEVAVRAAAQVVRLRRHVTKMWREAGIEEEIRKVRRDIDRSVPKLPPVEEMIEVAEQSAAFELKPEGMPDDRLTPEVVGSDDPAPRLEPSEEVHEEPELYSVPAFEAAADDESEDEAGAADAGTAEATEPAEPTESDSDTKESA